MERKALTCSQCDAPVQSDRCEYCGAVFDAKGKPKVSREEQEKIDQFNMEYQRTLLKMTYSMYDTRIFGR